MKPLGLLIAACGIVVACGDGTENPVTPAEPAPPAFVLLGTVQDEDGAAVSGAAVEITEGRYKDLSTATDAQGHFAFVGVRGHLVLRITKLGYEGRLQGVLVSDNQLIEIRLDRAAVIELGKTIRAVTGEPPCDPVRWDANAPCRRFYFTSPSSGRLVIVVTWKSGPDLDATMLTESDDYLAHSNLTGASQITLQATVDAGLPYEIRVNSYYQTQEFDLKADLHPTTAPFKKE
jgi:hypothetical protein